MRNRLLGLIVLLVVAICGNWSAQSITSYAEDLEQNNRMAEEIYTCVNPVYQNDIRQEDLNPISDEGIAANAAAEAESDENLIAQQIRDAMINRQEHFNVYFISAENYSSEWFNNWVELALEDSEDFHAGDYLRWNYAGYTIKVSYQTGISGSKVYMYDISMTYYTTLEQEKELDAAITGTLSELGVDGSELTDYEKTQRIYKYICDHVTYDYEHLNVEEYKLKFTAYAAMMNDTAVCQGYATLLYRMLEEAGIDARVVSGLGGGGAHGWNLSRLGNKYYYSDSTWDAGTSQYRYFLKGENDFDNHQADSTFLDEYNIALTEYNASQGTDEVKIERVYLNKNVIELENGGQAALQVSWEPEGAVNAKKIKWESSNEKVAVVDENGIVTARGYGETEITVTVDGLSEKCRVIVAVPKGWVQDSNGWWYRNADGSYPRNGWAEIDGEWYYFNASGYRVTGWQEIGKKWYYMNTENGIMQTGWIKVGKSWYYMSGSGAMCIGWEFVDGNWYYLESSGSMTIGWKKISGKWYYFNNSGEMITGVRTIGNVGYCFNDSGVMEIGWFESLEHKWYYCDGNGAIQKGWVKVGNNWYYMDHDTGVMYEEKWLNDTYYLQNGGSMAKGWLKIQGDYYYFSSSGEKVTNKWIGNYYLKENGIMAVDEWIGNYHVDSNGKWDQTR